MARLAALSVHAHLSLLLLLVAALLLPLSAGVTVEQKYRECLRRGSARDRMEALRRQKVSEACLSRPPNQQLCNLDVLEQVRAAANLTYALGEHGTYLPHRQTMVYWCAECKRQRFLPDHCDVDKCTEHARFAYDASESSEARGCVCEEDWMNKACDCGVNGDMRFFAKLQKHWCYCRPPAYGKHCQHCPEHAHRVPNGTCVCNEFWTGTRCHEPSCANGGTLRLDGNLWQCQCPQQWAGLHCQVTSVCDNGGTPLGEHTCVCPVGFRGSRCERRLERGLTGREKLLPALCLLLAILVLVCCCCVVVAFFYGKRRGRREREAESDSEEEDESAELSPVAPALIPFVPASESAEPLIAKVGHWRTFPVPSDLWKCPNRSQPGDWQPLDLTTENGNRSRNGKHSSRRSSPTYENVDVEEEATDDVCFVGMLGPVILKSPKPPRKESEDGGYDEDAVEEYNEERDNEAYCNTEGEDEYCQPVDMSMIEEHDEPSTGRETSRIDGQLSSLPLPESSRDNAAKLGHSSDADESSVDAPPSARLSSADSHHNQNNKARLLSPSEDASIGNRLEKNSSTTAAAPRLLSPGRPTASPTSNRDDDDVSDRDSLDSGPQSPPPLKREPPPPPAAAANEPEDNPGMPDVGDLRLQLLTSGRVSPITRRQSASFRRIKNKSQRNTTTANSAGSLVSAAYVVNEGDGDDQQQQQGAFLVRLASELGGGEDEADGGTPPSAGDTPKRLSRRGRPLSGSFSRLLHETLTANNPAPPSDNHTDPDDTGHGQPEEPDSTAGEPGVADVCSQSQMDVNANTSEPAVAAHPNTPVPTDP